MQLRLFVLSSTDVASRVRRNALSALAWILSQRRSQLPKTLLSYDVPCRRYIRINGAAVRMSGCYAVRTLPDNIRSVMEDI